MATDRRRWLVSAAAGVLGFGAGVLGWREGKRPAPSLTDAPPRPGTQSDHAALPGAPGMLEPLDAGVPFTVTARALEHELWPGQRVRMLAYEFEQSGHTLRNPVLRVRPGAVISARFWNQLDEASIIHWHGLRVDANNDGNPHYAVQPGEIYEYRIPVYNRAATCWYHPHPHGLTAHQVYRGLAGFLVVQDDDDDALARSLDLRLGATDLPLMLQDRHLDADGQFVRAVDAAGLFLGHLGSVPMVNYTRDARLDAVPRIYRLRLLNGSSSRVFRLAFTRDARLHPFTVIGSDGGLLERPIAAQEAFLAPGERLDVLLDLRSVAPGSTLKLASLAFDAMREPLAALCTTSPPAPAAAHAVHAAAAAASTTAPRLAARPVADGAAMDLLSIRVHAGARDDRPVPPRLCRAPQIDSSGARVRRFDLDHARMQWTINGVRFDMLKTQLSVERGSIEIWELHNPPGGMPHPIHFHGFPFRMLERAGSPPQVRRLALDGRGLGPAETGWKDTVLLWPGERVRLALDFSHDYPGEQVYMLHCHNLEHEDQGMMLNVRIVPPGSGRAWVQA